MTSEELNRTIEFIVASQSRLSAAQEQDRQDRVAFEKWSKNLTVQVVRVLDHQSSRLDRQDKLLDRQDKFFEETRAFQRQALHLLNLILDRLPPASKHEAT
jgi:hypothetical protein